MKMRKGDGRPVENTFVLPDSKYSLSAPCPRCSGKMTPGVYYIARKAGTTVKVDSSQIGLGKVTRTVTTQYRDIRRRVGGICLKCWSEAFRKDRKSWLIIGCIAAAIGLGCLIPLIFVLTRPEFAEQNGPVVNLLFILGTLGGGGIALKAFPNTVSMAQEIEMVLGNENDPMTQYRISAVLVAQLNAQGDTDRADNEVLLNSGTVDDMRGALGF